jgi:hypothetical protein
MEQMPAMGQLFVVVTVLFDQGMEKDPTCPKFQGNARQKFVCSLAYQG